MESTEPRVADRLADAGSEVRRALVVIASFVAITVGAAAIGHQTAAVVPATSAYAPGAVAPDAPSERLRPSIWLVDGFNLLHAAVLRSGDSRKDWWKRANRARVLELARGFEDRDAEVVVVFDGSEDPDETSEAGPRVVFAPTADDWLLATVKAAPHPHRVAVVTADRRLADRLRDRGAQVVSPSSFAARCRL
jgi:predicted RNA-binding protein with PIN domain